MSPRRRMLVRGGREQPLIPRYFDLLVLLVERRHEAVHRRDIFEQVWSDVVVSDSALSQAIRTIRRTLNDDPREPRFIRTVSRHGYRFVFNEVIEEDDEGAWPFGEDATVAQPPSREMVDAFEPLLERLTRVTRTITEEEEQREAAELLHGLGTAEALERLGTRPRHAFARAVLRDTRWETPGAGEVPLLGKPSAPAAAAALVGIRLRRASRVAAVRLVAGSIGGGVAGMIGGVVGGLILAAAPDSLAPLSVVPVLAVIGGSCGAIGGAGVSAGMSMAEAIVRSRRMLALVCGASAGGALVGLIVQWLARWSLEALVGVHLAVGGGLEGLVIGGAAGIGFAVATSHVSGGLAAPRGRRRLTAAAITAAACGLGALLLTAIGRPLVGGTIHNIAVASRSAQVVLTPLGRLIGEPDFGPVSRVILGTGEGTLFGIGLALGLTRRSKR